ncbi:MAG: hypothetical protein ABI759_11255 [Candidatus Solibacter sp.]
MNQKTIIPAAVAMISSALAITVFAQGPVGDEVKVTFDRPVQVGSKMLPAGDYLIKQVTSASNPRVLEFLSDDGKKLDATVTAIPVLQNTPPSETKVILQDEGGGARLSRIWVEGKTYGYAFPGTAMPATQANAATAQLSGSYAGAPAVAAVAGAERTVEAPPATPAPAPVPETPVAAPAPAPEMSAAAQAPAETPAIPADIPATGLGWVDIMAAGLIIAVGGLMLHRRELRRS